MRRLHCLFFTVCLLFTCIAFIPARANDTEAQRAMAQKFLEAYVRQDLPTVRKYLPADTANLFCAYPFKVAPTLSAPKVDDHEALVEFTGPTTDGKLPAKGGILFRKWDNIWCVRQVLFYDKIPYFYRLPSRSLTENDRRQEPKVRSIALAFMSAWEQGKTAEMLPLWFNWTKMVKKPINGLTMSNLVIATSATSWGDPYVTYTAKLTYHFGPLAYSITFKGGLVLTKENGEYKVRANQMIFDF